MASTKPRPIPTGAANDYRMKKEVAVERVKLEPRDEEMKDVFSHHDAQRRSSTPAKCENNGVKHEMKSAPQEHRVQAPVAPPKNYGAGAGVLVPPPRAPGQMPVKRKKAPANGALLDNKRKKH